MNCNPTLTADEFKTIHNSLYQLDCLNNDQVSAIVEQMRDALKGAYDQEDAAWDKKHAHFSRVKDTLALESIWSMYEVDDLAELHPFEGAKQVVYKPYDGPEVVANLRGTTWASLYVAADSCIKNSGDKHHVFIENFAQSSVNPEVLFLTTGS